MIRPKAICFWLNKQWTWVPDLGGVNVGTSIAAKTAITQITTNNSISVNPLHPDFGREIFIVRPR